MSANATQPNYTEHALLVLLGQYAQHLGLIQAADGCAVAPKDLYPPSTEPRFWSSWWPCWPVCRTWKTSAGMAAR